MDETPPSSRGALLARLGVGLLAASWLVSIVGMLIGTVKAYRVLETSGAGDPERLSAAIGDVLIFALAMKGSTFVCFALITTAITAYRYRAAWMFYFLCFYGLLMIGLNACMLFFTSFHFDVYFAFGIFFVYFTMAKKEEFQRAAKAAYKLPSCYNLDD